MATTKNISTGINWLSPMVLHVARSANGFTVRYCDSQFRMILPRLNVVSVQFCARLSAVGAGSIGCGQHVLSPLVGTLPARVLSRRAFFKLPVFGPLLIAERLWERAVCGIAGISAKYARTSADHSFLIERSQAVSAIAADLAPGLARRSRDIRVSTKSAFTIRIKAFFSERYHSFRSCYAIDASFCQLYFARLAACFPTTIPALGYCVNGKWSGAYSALPGSGPTVFRKTLNAAKSTGVHLENSAAVLATITSIARFLLPCASYKIAPAFRANLLEFVDPLVSSLHFNSISQMESY